MSDREHKRRLAADRRASRIIGENGRWFSPLCPPEQHGKASGATYWFCQCTPCLAYNRRNAQNQRDRRKFNNKILSTLKPGPTSRGGAKAPGAHLRDAARTNGFSLPAGKSSAPTVDLVDDGVGPTQVPPGPTNPDEYRADLLRQLELAGMVRALKERADN